MGKRVPVGILARVAQMLFFDGAIFWGQRALGGVEIIEANEVLL